MTDEVLAAMVETPAPQGIAAVCRMLDVGLEALVAGLPDDAVVCVLTNVRDPGNAGTVVRGADAAGADAVIVSDASVDVYNSKVVRSTAGSLWHLPVVRRGAGPGDPRGAACAGRRAARRRRRGTTCCPTPTSTGRTPGSWATRRGGSMPRCATPATTSCASRSTGCAESLNLAMAATVCLYASAGARELSRHAPR